MEPDIRPHSAQGQVLGGVRHLLEARFCHSGTPKNGQFWLGSGRQSPPKQDIERVILQNKGPARPALVFDRARGGRRGPMSRTRYGARVEWWHRRAKMFWTISLPR